MYFWWYEIFKFHLGQILYKTLIIHAIMSRRIFYNVQLSLHTITWTCYSKAPFFHFQVIVRAAGHILPYDQPERGYDMIQRFIENRSFY